MNCIIIFIRLEKIHREIRNYEKKISFILLGFNFYISKLNLGEQYAIT